MTAERWWVRFGARWIARVDSVKSHLNLAFTAMTAVGVASGALKYYGLAHLAPYFLSLTGLAMLGYAYLYSEGGVWNQVSRDKVDLSDNYSGPTMLMDAEIEAAQFAKLAYILQNGEADDYEELFEEFQTVTEAQWAEMRDGIDVEAMEEARRQ